MKKIVVLLLVLSLIGTASAGPEVNTGVNHDVEVTIKRAGIGNMIQAKWMEVEEDINNFLDGLFGSNDQKKPEKWAS